MIVILYRKSSLFIFSKSLHKSLEHLLPFAYLLLNCLGKDFCVCVVSYYCAIFMPLNTTFFGSLLAGVVKGNLS